MNRVSDSGGDPGTSSPSVEVVEFRSQSPVQPGCSASFRRVMCRPPTQTNSSDIEQQLALDKEKLRTTIKLLLLGTGESGKSTFLKQMRIIHCGGYSDMDRSLHRMVIIDHIIRSTRATIISMHGQIHTEDESLARNCEAFLRHTEAPNKKWPVDAMEDLLTDLWSNDHFKSASMNPKCGANDNTDYFVSNISRIFADDYSPTDQDILNARMETCGIVELEFETRRKLFRVIDVGGQRSQRRKWINCFDDVHAVIFILAISEYDQVLREDMSTNRMHESLKLFGGISNSAIFRRTHMLLFLNKTDIFREKLKLRSLHCAFGDYVGDGSYEDSSEFIKNKFSMACTKRSNRIYTYFTCATDSKQTQIVLDVAFDIIQSKSMATSGVA